MKRTSQYTPLLDASGDPGPCSRIYRPRSTNLCHTTREKEVRSSPFPIFPTQMPAASTTWDDAEGRVPFKSYKAVHPYC